MSSPPPAGQEVKNTKGSDKATMEAQNKMSNSDAPASLSADGKKKVPRDKPSVKPPFAGVTMQKFLMNLFLIILAILAFYAWRITVWASDAGGYWALMTGKYKTGAAKEADMLAGALASQASAASSAMPSTTGKPGSVPKGGDIQAQIYSLAASLGVKPADLSAAIRPLTDPTAPNPMQQVEALKEKVKDGKETVEEAKQEGLGMLGFVEEAFLD